MTDVHQGSQEKGVIILPAEVLEGIDQNRDTLSRAEFVELSINTLLKQEKRHTRLGQQAASGTTIERAEVESTVSRKEFEQFKKGIKDLQRAYLDLLLTFCIEPISKASKEEQEHLTQRVRGLLEEEWGAK